MCPHPSRLLWKFLWIPKALPPIRSGLGSIGWMGTEASMGMIDHGNARPFLTGYPYSCFGGECPSSCISQLVLHFLHLDVKYALNLKDHPSSHAAHSLYSHQHLQSVMGPLPSSVMQCLDRLVFFFFRQYEPLGTPVFCIGAAHTQQRRRRERPILLPAPCTNGALISIYCIKRDHFTSENQ